MGNNRKKQQDYYVIDFAHIFKTLLRKLWLILVCGLICGAIGFSVASFVISPKYASSVMLYVNNSSLSLGNSGFSISSSELTAAQSLVKTYTVILKNRTTLNEVISKSGYTDLTYETLYRMIEAESVNETEVLEVRVTVPDDPVKAAKLANTIAEVLPNRISDIIEGSSMEVVDVAVVDNQKVSPSITRYTEIGLLFGFAVSTIIVVIIAMLDDTIHDEDYFSKTYDYPILAVVPDLLGSSDKKYGYYYKYKREKKDSQ